MLLSNQTSGGPGLNPEYKSEFVKSALWVRRSACCAPMLESGLMVDPTQNNIVQSPHRGQVENKSARRRQWLAGWEAHAVIHDQLWSGMLYDSGTVTRWIDAFGHDTSLVECILHRFDAKWSRQQVVATTMASC